MPVTKTTARFTSWEEVPASSHVTIDPPRSFVVSWNNGRDDDGDLTDRFRDVLRGPRAKIAHRCAVAAAREWTQNRTIGEAFAELSATGASAESQKIAKDEIAAEAGVPSDAVDRVLDHRDDVLRWMRATAKARCTDEFKALRTKWVAVSGVDDAPRRPVNILMTDAEQEDIVVPLEGGRKVRVRAALRGSHDRMILLLHGGGSRLEEVDHLGRALEKLGYSVLSVDYPGYGCSERVAATIGGLDPLRRVRNDQYPYLSFLDDFFPKFLAAARAHSGWKVGEKKLVAVGGGSLGGNLALRIAQGALLGPDVACLAWSPGSAWNPLIRRAQEQALDVVTMRDPLDPLGQGYLREVDEDHIPPDAVHEGSTFPIQSRRRFFWAGFHFVIPTVGPVSHTWYHPRWPHRGAAVRAAEREREEVYGQHHRHWVWRHEYEQTVFSWRNPAPGGNDWRIHDAFMNSNVLLLAGDGDNFPGAKIYDNVDTIARRFAELETPKKVEVQLWTKTGHSFHDERPTALARAIDTYLTGL